MAWRIDEAVTRGEIDNTVEGRTTGRIWLAGRDEPLILTLVGDCWRDLAGTRLWFENPVPAVMPDTAALAGDQTGIVGDMTASRKNKVPTVSDEELHRLCQCQAEIPHEWRNTLYLEWFSEINGRVVISSSAYAMKISDYAWAMDEDAEEAQKLANLNTMRDFMARLIRRSESPSSETDTDGELDEFAWEERLKESDRLTDAYQEVIEKYMEDVDSERKEAFVMGWDGLLDALAQRDEAANDDFSPETLTYGQRVDVSFEDNDEDEYLDPDEAFLDEEDDDDDEDAEDDHPLQMQAQELAMRAMDVVQQDAGPGTPAYQFITSLLQVSGKLAGALNGRISGYQPETGFVLAILKRCLHSLNEAVGSCQKLMAEENDPDQLAALAHLRSSVFAIRDDIVELRRALK
ncbi:MAG: hypothetical protein NTV46_19245 [Verrucomicrobia bacterium]|nr:hypothetical protein [Verrucomicrobiota bacterium]